MANVWQENKVNIIGWAVVLLVVAGGIALAVSSNNQRQEATVAELEIRADDHVQGNESAPVTMIEYSDFQCPACAQYEQILAEVKQQRGDKIKFVYRHFPLETIHPNAVAAGIASEAASLQGKFWEMHALLFANQTAWQNLGNPTDAFVAYAEQLDLDIEKFKADLEDESLEARVRRDLAGGESMGVDSTPTFYINGEQVRAGSLTADIVRMIDKYAK